MNQQQINLVKQFATLNGPKWVKLDRELSVQSDPHTQEKYKQLYLEKLQKRAQSEGKSVEQLLEEVRQQKSAFKKNATADAPTETLAATPSASAKKTEGKLPSYCKPLDQILNLNKIKLESPETIGEIWNTYHASKECISAVIPVDTYQKLHEKSKRFPMFVLPLPRDDGYELFLLQFSGHQIYLTTLLEYQTNREGARPQFVITHYTELSEKGIVLMVGESSSSSLQLKDAQHLVYQIQLFYITGSDKQQQLVEKFWNNPSAFDHNELIQALAEL
ncbi:ATP11 protein-domain-containing protein [Gorgonomyces haynaldii]|nr:ATP11 protein-domain-containing protein [Gorgonomyces haynaldii]